MKKIKLILTTILLTIFFFCMIAGNLEVNGKTWYPTCSWSSNSTYSWPGYTVNTNGGNKTDSSSFTSEESGTWLSTITSSWGSYYSYWGPLIFPVKWQFGWDWNSKKGNALTINRALAWNSSANIWQYQWTKTLTDSSYTNFASIADYRSTSEGYYNTIDDYQKYQYYLGTICMQQSESDSVDKSSSDARIVGRIVFNEPGYWTYMVDSDGFETLNVEASKFFWFWYFYNKESDLSYGAASAFVFANVGRGNVSWGYTGNGKYYPSFAQWVYWYGMKESSGGYLSKFYNAIEFELGDSGDKSSVTTGSFNWWTSNGSGETAGGDSNEESQEVMEAYEAAEAYQTLNETSNSWWSDFLANIFSWWFKSKSATGSYDSDGNLIIGPITATFPEASTNNYYLAGIYGKALHYVDSNGKAQTLDSNSNDTEAGCTCENCECEDCSCNEWWTVASEDSTERIRITNGTAFYIYIPKSTLENRDISYVEGIDLKYKRIWAYADVVFIDSGQDQPWAVVGNSKLYYTTRTYSYTIETSGSISLSKTASYYEGSTKKTDSITAGFKIYCKEKGAWLVESTSSSGNSTSSGSTSSYLNSYSTWLTNFTWGSSTSNSSYTYTTDISKATTFASGSTVSDLSASYTYQVYEVSVSGTDAEYYQDLKMDSATVDGVSVTPSYNSTYGYYYVGDITVSPGETTAVKVTDVRTYGDLTVQKVNAYDQTVVVPKVGIKIYYTEEKGKAGGWLTYSSADGYSYDGTIDNCTTFTTDTNGAIKLECVKTGYYYIYEVSTPAGYAIQNQPGYLKTTEFSDNTTAIMGYQDFATSADWAYLGVQQLQDGSVAGSSNSITSTCLQYSNATLQINKVDAIDTTKSLDGAQFIIYAVLENGTKGWVSGDSSNTSTTKSYVASVSNATVYSTEEITNLSYGTYYIYEITAPTTDNNYVLIDQENYKVTTLNGTQLPGASDISTTYSEWTYCDSVYLTFTSNNSNTTEVNITNRPEVTLQLGDNSGSGSISSTTGKIDSITGESISGVEFKVYGVLDNGNPTAGWVTGTEGNGELKTYGSLANSTSYSSGTEITRLRYGTYYIYEILAGNEDYDLRDQSGYHSTNNGEAKGYTDFAEDVQWVYIGYITVNFNTTENTSGICTLEPIKNDVKAQLQIEKVDETYNELKLEGAEFVIYADLSSSYITDGWLSGNAEDTKQYVSSSNNATTYKTGSNGLTDIIKRLNYGTYYIYEVTAPDGYDITMQNNYNVGPTGVPTPSTSNWAYLGSISITAGSTDAGIATNTIVPFECTVTNIKGISSVEGRVWEDVADTIEERNYLYNAESTDNQDIDLSDIKVYLHVGSAVFETKTGLNGAYEFKELEINGNVVTYWDLATAYVEFVYDNEEYIVVDPFVGSNTEINSKAQEYTVTQEKLEDDNLTGTVGTNPGAAVTYKDGTLSSIDDLLENTEDVEDGTADLSVTPLTGYYTKDSDGSYKIANINLGLQAKEEATFTISQNLSYVYVEMNGYSYTYNYDGSPSDTTSTYSDYNSIPTAKTKYNVSVYPSDIAAVKYDSANNSLKIYLVYDIYVYNSKTTKEDDVYYEQKLYLNELTVIYDKDKFTLSEIDNNYADQISTNIKLWDDSDEDGTADYNLATDTLYSDGIAPGETIKTNMELEVKEDTLVNLLTETKAEGITQVTAEGYHEYKRTDNLWEEGSRAYSGYRGTYSNEDQDEDNNTINSEGDKYYIHKSKTESINSEELTTVIRLTNSSDDDSDDPDNPDPDTPGNTTNTTDPDNPGNSSNTTNTTDPDDPGNSSNTTNTTDPDDPGNSSNTTNTTDPDDPDDPSGGGEDTEESDERKISGIVYEDFAESGTTEVGGNTYSTYLGNGIIDTDSETNIGVGVTVELLKSDKTNVAIIYPESEGYAPIEAIQVTDENGEYTFAGVIPGYYYIRFTYGDGTQKIVDTNNNEVALTSVDYKSTIINTEDDEADDTIKDAMEITDSKKTEAEDNLKSYYSTSGTATDEQITQAREALEWYKYLSGDTSYNTAVDDLSIRENYDNYTYTETGIYDSSGNTIVVYEYDEDTGNLIMKDSFGNVVYKDGDYTGGGDYPLTIKAYTPEISISIENTLNNYVDITNSTSNEAEVNDNTSHGSMYGGFNFGVVKQPETNIVLTHTITKIDLTLQNGSTVISADIQDGETSADYVSVLDTIGQSIGTEVKEEEIYGSNLEVTYKIEIENESEADYTDDDGSYFKYGIVTDSAEQKTAIVEAVISNVDSKFTLNKDNWEEVQNYVGSSSSTINNIEITKYTSVVDDNTVGDATTLTSNALMMTGWPELAIGESTSVMYTLSAILNTDNDTEFITPAKVTAISLNEMTTLTSGSVWNVESEASEAVYASTGKNKSNTIYVAITIGLIIMAGGIVILLKRRNY